MNNTGTHESGQMTFNTGAKIKQRYIFVTFKENKVIPASGSKAVAVGVATDAVDAVDTPINVTVLNSNTSTLKVFAGESINAGDFLSTDTSGQAVNVKNLPAGAHQVHGVALGHAFSGELVEFTPTLGAQVTNK